MNHPQSTETVEYDEKKDQGDGEPESKDNVIRALQARVKALEGMMLIQNQHGSTYYATGFASTYGQDSNKIKVMPESGMPASHVSEMIHQIHSCDFSPRLNTSSYVNVVSEPEEREIGALGARVNIADASVYPASVLIHDTVVNMIAELWHAPKPENGDNYCGAGTVGSTEACLLAGLALKFRWRHWYGRLIEKSPTSQEVVGVKPNLVISTCYQAAWEKFFRYFDITPKFCHPKLLENSMIVDAQALCELCDEKTIGVVAILGNHYNGAYDPVWEIDKELTQVNKEKGLQVGIHIDAASGGFVAPFQQGMEDKPFDFRLDNVLSISASGHKFGESVCGTGWIVFRERKDLAEHIASTVTYLGGHCDSKTLNFSRPASGVYVQYYKLGYRTKIRNQMRVAAFLRGYLPREAKDIDGNPYFQILDGRETCHLPVVAARLNPDLKLPFDDIDLQHALSESHWYVSGYDLGFENPDGGEELALFADVPAEASMFRIVVKSNLTMSLAQNLKQHFFQETLPVLIGTMQDGYRSMRLVKAAIRKELDKEPDTVTISPAIPKVANLMLAANKWRNKTSAHKRKRPRTLATTC